MELILEKWNKLDWLEKWLEKASKIFEIVPADLTLMKSKLLWRNKKFEETLCLLSRIKLEDVSDAQKQNYLTLKAKCLENSKNFDRALLL